MDNDELKNAMFKGLPVEYQDMEFLRISAIIYRADKTGKLWVQVELMDKNNNSVAIAAPEKVHLKQGEVTC